jgi:cytochrome b561
VAGKKEYSTRLEGPRREVCGSATVLTELSGISIPSHTQKPSHFFFFFEFTNLQFAQLHSDFANAATHTCRVPIIIIIIIYHVYAGYLQLYGQNK